MLCLRARSKSPHPTSAPTGPRRRGKDHTSQHAGGVFTAYTKLFPIRKPLERKIIAELCSPLFGVEPMSGEARNCYSVIRSVFGLRVPSNGADALAARYIAE